MATGSGQRSAEPPPNAMDPTSSDKLKDQELLVFGYACKLFRDNEKALFIDSGKHLIPWMADESLKIDRYDGRGTLSDLRQHEPPPGGYDRLDRLTDRERKLEEVVDRERYMALYKDEDEERMLEEEEWKRLQSLGGGTSHGYSQIGFNYDGVAAAALPEPVPAESAAATSQDERYEPPASLSVPDGMARPTTRRQADIIERTAHFVARQGPQMEILIKAKQSDNGMFNFLSFDNPLQPFFRHMVVMIKAGRHTIRPQKQEEDSDAYLHPALNISHPDIAPGKADVMYQPSANCAYQLLVKNIRSRQAADSPGGSGTSSPVLSTSAVKPIAAAASAPVATAVKDTGSLSSSSFSSSSSQSSSDSSDSDSSSDGAESGSQPDGTQKVSKAARRRKASKADKTLKQPSKTAQADKVAKAETVIETVKAVDTVEAAKTAEVDGAVQEMAPTPALVVPTADVKIIIDKMASYVAKNGRDFEGIVMKRGDTRFSFLQATHWHHAYYRHKLTQYEHDLSKAPKIVAPKIAAPTSKPDIPPPDPNKPVPVSFSIRPKSEKETAPLERSALPLEESDDDEKEEAAQSSVATIGDDTRLQKASAAPAVTSVVASRQDSAKKQSRQVPVVAPAPGVGRDEIQLDRKRRAAQFLAKLRQDADDTKQPIIGPLLPPGPLPADVDSDTDSDGRSSELPRPASSPRLQLARELEPEEEEEEEEESGDDANLDKYRLVDSDSPRSVPEYPPEEASPADRRVGSTASRDTPPPDSRDALLDDLRRTSDRASDSEQHERGSTGSRRRVSRDAGASDCHDDRRGASVDDRSARSAERHHSRPREERHRHPSDHRQRRRHRHKKPHSHHRRRRHKRHGSGDEDEQCEREAVRSRSPRKHRKRRKRTHSPPASYKRVLSAAPPMSAAMLDPQWRLRAARRRATGHEEARVSPSHSKRQRSTSTKRKHKSKKIKRSRRSPSRSPRPSPTAVASNVEEITEVHCSRRHPAERSSLLSEFIDLTSPDRDRMSCQPVSDVVTPRDTTPVRSVDSRRAWSASGHGSAASSRSGSPPPPNEEEPRLVEDEPHLAKDESLSAASDREQDDSSRCETDRHVRPDPAGSDRQEHRSGRSNSAGSDQFHLAEEIAQLKQKLVRRPAAASANGAARLVTAAAPPTCSRFSNTLVAQMAEGLKAKVAEMMEESLLNK